jgi:hypothetical protein
VIVLTLSENILGSDPFETLLMGDSVYSPQHGLYHLADRGIILNNVMTSANSVMTQDMFFHGVEISGIDEVTPEKRKRKYHEKAFYSISLKIKHL